jgi:hypothetical protein
MATCLLCCSKACALHSSRIKSARCNLIHGVDYKNWAITWLKLINMVIDDVHDLLEIKVLIMGVVVGDVMFGVLYGTGGR